ncbi:5-methyltetrahydropteroyltriglutamate--homocysteine S-methyltransferase [Halobacillus mangrovi]|uniref:5-methyltetrahydropteroyltriglutamate--homocysteine methyltransferase n=1 Tax=Halobacillus mangrovi TaxID=402384 RepID=A0A1W5ZXA1_9BACI|nr:5-methyltetrahydropteroyltriglutamate--homocysteine S-methyltransferase [Halobacillus mangrovi]ARI77893.1 5-methyltetrahydropteroyltriglutamate--homocysteine S-methyltransferase [Halobacillus mangrovi]
MTQVLSSSIGYPRIGEKREWKKALERFWKGSISEDDLLRDMKKIRLTHLRKQKNLGIDLIPVGDFSFYDHVLDTAFMFGLIPSRFKERDYSINTYFEIARGNDEAVASEMTKWFNTNYHYIVPEIQSDHTPELTHNYPLQYYKEAKEELGLTTKPVLLGPITFIKLAKGFEETDSDSLLEKLVPLYIQVLEELVSAGADWIQVDEPILSTSISEKDLQRVKDVYHLFHSQLPGAKILLQTYFEAVDHYEEIISLPVAGIGLDIVHDEGANVAALKKYGFPTDKTLAVGLINGRNIWRTDLENKLSQIEEILSETQRLIVQPSCSLLHVPVTVETEQDLDPILKNGLAFADQKLAELTILTRGINHGRDSIQEELTIQMEKRNQLWTLKQNASKPRSDGTDLLTKRNSDFERRQNLQQAFFDLPLLPTTTIGSLPQTKGIRQARLRWRQGEWSNAYYDTFIKNNISEWINRQEELGLDVLVHGEFERNDMVEFFGEKLEGFAFTRFGWVQSYGSRCVKPPIITSDVSWKESMTVKEICYAQSLTNKPVKGMLTGPITILNWSFVREDITRFDVTKQIALALEKEIKALEEQEIRMIQVDEPALREGLPLKPEKQNLYLEQAVYAFKLATSSVKDETQIHTHMCYSEFGEIMETIDQLDADVISIEATRSHGEIIADFEIHSYKKGIGLGVYDIHSPRVPQVEEMETNIQRALQVLDPRQFWVNPDCGLKTRGIEETEAALTNMVDASKKIREQIKEVVRK